MIPYIFRFFNPTKYTPGKTNLDEIWNMGETITCDVVKDKMIVKVPAGFNGSLPFKIFTHGFNDKLMKKDVLEIVNVWMKAESRKANLILFQWDDLVNWLDSNNYDKAASNAIATGEYFGHCLAQLSKNEGIYGGKVHLVGHSLGAHLMGKAGRIFKQETQVSISRITGLDPAGPRFIDGPVMKAIPKLYRNRISKKSANFVDIIHTDGAEKPAAAWVSPHFGDFHALGHADYYPAGGHGDQPGCSMIGCSHGRSIRYFLHSVKEPSLFPCWECSSPWACRNKPNGEASPGIFMGAPAQVCII